jgi:hypothetical protein
MSDRSDVYRESQERKAEVGVKWVKADDSDTTYLCKSSDLDNLRAMSDAELRKICLDESQNPQND